MDPFTIDEATYPEAQSVAFMETRVFLRGSYVQLPMLLELLGALRGMGPRGDAWAEWGEEARSGLANGGGGGLLEGEDDGVALSEIGGGGIRGWRSGDVFNLAVLCLRTGVHGRGQGI